MLKAPLKLSLLILWIGLCYPPAWVARKLKKTGLRDRLVQFCYSGILAIVGVRLKIVGTLAENRPLLLVSNHLSYLDVCILGSTAPVRFTPKSDIAAWPVVGNICRLCDAVFIDRQPQKLAEVKPSLEAALLRNEVLCLFPEATTGNGMHLLPFKSGFFSLAEDVPNVTVQPVAISYTRIRRLPIDSTQWPDIAWYGDMKLFPHLLKLLQLGGVDAEFHFLSPVMAGQFGDRKQLATRCHQEISKTLNYVRERRFDSNPVKISLLMRLFGKSA